MGAIRLRLTLIISDSIREPRPAKIQAYLAETSKEYLVRLAIKNTRNISAQLDLILKEKMAAGETDA